jgi:hypothetical protein
MKKNIAPADHLKFVKIKNEEIEKNDDIEK